MNKSYNYFAVDLGATSGRTILCTIDNGKMEMREVTRFPNHIIEMTGHCYWDIYALYNEIIRGLKTVAKEGVAVNSIGIDTWGVDFVMFGKDGGVIRNPYCYRDSHTVGVPEKFFNVVPSEEVYAMTGIQVLNFNSLFQLYALRLSGCSALDAADKILFIPDALSYLLTGKMVMEYTIASTSHMLNPVTKDLEPKLLEAIGLRRDQFARLVFPGEVVGALSEEVQRLTGLGAVPVIAVAGHDTGSAVAAVPATSKHFAYLSSGTWSLMGIEVVDPIINEKSRSYNFTNEGGINGTTRFIKNICGMWLLERCRGEWKENGEDVAYGDLIDQAIAVEPFRSIIFPDAECFANPNSMVSAIKTYCQATNQPVPESNGEITRCIFDSLALRYREVFGLLNDFAPFEIDVLHVIGGGSRNNLLNQFTCNAVGVPVIAGPSECTAIGNVMIQAQADGLVDGIEAMRKLIGDSVETARFEPQDAEIWNAAFDKFQKVCTIR